MALVNINTLSSAAITGEVAIKVYRNNIPFEVTMAQLKDYANGDTSVINDTDTVLHVNKSTGRGTRIAILQLKEYMSDGQHLSGNALLPVYVNGVPKRVAATVVKNYVSNVSSFFYNPIMQIEI